MKTLIIMQGAPGSGKSTVAQSLIEPYLRTGNYAEICSADNYFLKLDENGNLFYKFDAARLPLAHDWCRRKAEGAAYADSQLIVIDNTNIRIEHARPYAQIAQHFSYQLQIVRCYGTFQNIHGVPDAVVERMRGSMEDLSTLLNTVF